MRLYTLSDVDLSEEPPERTTEWRDSCSETLMMTVNLFCYKLYHCFIFLIIGKTAR